MQTYIILVNVMQVGDYVTRKKYNNDILFKIKNINGNNIELIGVDLRLYADANINDLVLSTISKQKANNNLVRTLDTNKYFYIPGTILHLDSDKDYLNKCKNYYNSQKIISYCYLFDEKDYPKYIIKLMQKHHPNVIVITGHDAYYKNNNYKNSKYYIETVKKIRELYNDVTIFAGACQSDFKNLILTGANYASSPEHINIHALDPAIIASFVALSDKTKTINLEEILSKTESNSKGIGGINSFGKMIVGFPRKEE